MTHDQAPMTKNTRTAQPTNLQVRDGNKLIIVWDDGVSREYTFRELREQCPCATCREKRLAPAAPVNPLQVLSVAETKPITIASLKPVGNYAYSIGFSDGHDSGIYTLVFLQEIGRVIPN